MYAVEKCICNTWLLIICRGGVFMPLESHDFVTLHDMCALIAGGRLSCSVIDAYASKLMRYQVSHGVDGRSCSFVVSSTILVRIVCVLS